MSFEAYKKYHNYHRNNCPVCNGSSFSHWASHEYFEAQSCKNCNFVYINPSLNQEGLSVYYSDYIGDRFKNTKKMQDRAEQYKIDAKFIERFINEGNLLDVGCNGGFFLNALSEKFNKFGIEIDSEAVEFARKEYGLNVTEGVIGHDNFEENFFDLIIFRGVIEHLLEPSDALDRASTLLKPGGYIYFCATPNLQSFSADLYREKWNLWHPIEHINIFDSNTLHMILGKDKFEIFAEDYQYLGTPYEDSKSDYQRIKSDIILKENNQWDKVERSKPFWGNMMSLVYRKN